MPVLSFVIALFIVLGSSAVGLGGKLMVLSSLPVQMMHKNNVQREGLNQEIYPAKISPTEVVSKRDTEGGIWVMRAKPRPISETQT